MPPEFQSAQRPTLETLVPATAHPDGTMCGPCGSNAHDISIMVTALSAVIPS